MSKLSEMKDREAWRAVACGVARSRTRLSGLTTRISAVTGTHSPWAAISSQTSSVQHHLLSCDQQWEPRGFTDTQGWALGDARPAPASQKSFKYMLQKKVISLRFGTSRSNQM